MLTGSLAVTVGQQTHFLRAGQSAFAPRCTLRRFWNPTAAATIVLLIATPGCAEDELLAQEEPLSSATSPVPP